ncbi:MAG: hypothetical protein QHH09_00750 [Microgenomates group bacterium]|nr:hypothetical protein [Microgenomates group bacterium]
MENYKLLDNNKKLPAKAIVGIILLTVFSRLAPHPANFTPVAAVALFSGANFSSGWAFLIPLSAMFLSDFFLGFHSTMIYVYFSFLIIFYLGRLIKTASFRRIFFISVVSSVLFFLITNFGVWLTSGMYLKNLNGLIICYLNGLPFFRQTIVGDWVYVFGFFYGYRFLKTWFKQIKLFIMDLWQKILPLFQTHFNR